MKFLLGLWVIAVSIWYLAAYVGLVSMSRPLGFCLLSVIPLLIYDVVAYMIHDKYVGVGLCIGAVLIFFNQILKIFG